jgi:hypothetical protein
MVQITVPKKLEKQFRPLLDKGQGSVYIYLLILLPLTSKKGIHLSSSEVHAPVSANLKGPSS